MCVLRWDCEWLVEMEHDDRPLSCSVLPGLGICDLSRKPDVTLMGCELAIAKQAL